MAGWAQSEAHHLGPGRRRSHPRPPGRRHRVIRYLVGRFLQIIPVLFGVSLIVFTLVHLIPGDPVRGALGATAPPALVASTREALGLNDPL